MKRHVAIYAVLVVLVSALAQAQTYREPTPREPWPTDYGKLAAFVGSWSFDGEMKSTNAYGAPAGRYTYTERYEWLPGDFLVQMTRTGEGPAGEVRHSSTLGYYLTTKQYSLVGTDLLTGAVVSGTGTNEGDTWTFLAIGQLGEGKYFNERCTLTIAPDTYTVKCETSPDGKTWSAAFEGKGTRS